MPGVAIIRADPRYVEFAGVKTLTLKKGNLKGL
jgi:hypothetical protein